MAPSEWTTRSLGALSFLPWIVVDQHGDRAVVFGAGDAAGVVLAGEQAALAIAQVAVAVIRWPAEDADLSGIFEPAQDAVVGDVAEEQIAAVAKPYGALGPARAGVEPLDRGALDIIFSEARVQNFDGGIGVGDGIFPLLLAGECKRIESERGCAACGNVHEGASLHWSSSSGKMQPGHITTNSSSVARRQRSARLFTTKNKSEQERRSCTNSVRTSDSTAESRGLGYCDYRAADTGTLSPETAHLGTRTNQSREGSMKKRIALVLLAVGMAFAATAVPQTAGTNLVMGARWDNRHYIDGTVTLGKVNTAGPDTIIATKTLSKGWTNITESLAANSLYNVTLAASDGTQLVKFPITTALINPNNLQSAEIDIVCHASDHSLASARINVAMKF